MCSYLLVILFQVGQLLGEALDLHLQVRACHGQVIQNFPQAIDVGFHGLPEIQLILVPGKDNSRTGQSISNPSILA